MDQFQRATEMFNAGVAGNTGFGANIKFAFDDLGSIYIRGDGAVITVTNDEVLDRIFSQFSLEGGHTGLRVARTSRGRWIAAAFRRGRA